MRPGYMLTLQKFRLMPWGLLDEPLPVSDSDLVEIPAPAGEIRIGELDAKFGEMSVQRLTEAGALGSQNFGYPSRLAAIGQAFAIGRYELTYEQYDYYVWSSQGTEGAPDYPSGGPGNNGRGRRPVTNVSWNDANAYLAWLSGRTGEHYRLPTEAEWEYAARAETTSAYWWGEEAGQGHADCDGCGSRWDNKLVAPVGSFAANPWGLYDTAGNIWEWTCSEWQTELSGKAAACVHPDETSGSRAVRGGSWYDGTDWLRSSARGWFGAGDRDDAVGFRVLRAARTN
jgi:formylglycine-generating enzyme required for sulfatase activity